MTALVATNCDEKRHSKQTHVLMPVSLTAFFIARMSFHSTPSGFSMITCLPCFAARMNWSGCWSGKLVMSTAWMSGFASIDSRSVYASIGEPWRALSSLEAWGRDDQTAVTCA